MTTLQTYEQKQKEFGKLIRTKYHDSRISGKDMCPKNKVVMDMGPAFLTGCSADFFQTSKEYPSNTLYLVEPHPVCAKFCREESKDYSNIHVVEKAVSDFNGECKLYEPTNSECSSILKTNEDAVKKYWPFPLTLGFSFTDKTQVFDVEVVRLDKIIEDYGITTIDMLKIDIQGEDLRALKSSGKYLHIIKKGSMEAPVSLQNAIYKNQHTMDDCIQFLESNGFRVSEIEANDSHNLEVNIHFQQV